MSDRFAAFDDDTTPAPGQWAAYARSTARYGRRHHDTDDRWQPYRNTGQDSD